MAKPRGGTGSRVLRGVDRGRASRPQLVFHAGARGKSCHRTCGAIAQLGERLDRTQEVGGSSPPGSIARIPRPLRGFGRLCRSRDLRTDMFVCMYDRRHDKAPEHRPHLPALADPRAHRDFRLEDVWALPTPGGPDDFPRLVRYRRGRPGAGLLARRPAALGDPLEARGAARLGRPGHRPRLPGADAARAAARGPARARRARIRRAALQPRCTCSTTSSRRRSPTARSTASCTSAGSRRRGGYRGQMAVS